MQTITYRAPGSLSSAIYSSATMQISNRPSVRSPELRVFFNNHKMGYFSPPITGEGRYMFERNLRFAQP